MTIVGQQRILDNVASSFRQRACATIGKAPVADRPVVRPVFRSEWSVVVIDDAVLRLAIPGSSAFDLGAVADDGTVDQLGLKRSTSEMARLVPRQDAVNGNAAVKSPLHHKRGLPLITQLYKVAVKAAPPNPPNP
jgi:hypothetical protein